MGMKSSTQPTGGGTSSVHRMVQAVTLVSDSLVYSMPTISQLVRLVEFSQFQYCGDIGGGDAGGTAGGGGDGGGRAGGEGGCDGGGGDGGDGSEGGDGGDEGGGG